jgi:hypothetical protein
MRKRRIWRLASAIESRYPGARAVVEQWVCPDDPSICWWIEVLHVRAKDTRAVQDFADDLVDRMYGEEQPPFFVNVLDRRQSREYLASRREKERARRLRRRTLQAQGAVG